MSKSRRRSSFDPAIWTGVRTLIEQRGIDIVHAHDYKTDFLAWIASKRCGTIPLSTAHGFSGRSRKERLYYYFEKKILARFPRVIAVASHIANELVAAGVERSRICTVLNAIDPEKFRRDRDAIAPARARFGVPDGTIAIGSIGRLEEEKRYDELLHAIASLVAEGRPILLLIAGDGSLRTELEALRAKLSLNDHVRFLGHVDDVPAFHHALDLFVQSSEREGTPNAVLEAMAFETPIVATDAGGTRDLAADEEHALLSPIESPDQLTDRIRNALDDEPARIERTRRARARVETELSFSRRMKKVEAVYDELMKEAR